MNVNLAQNLLQVKDVKTFLETIAKYKKKSVESCHIAGKNASVPGIETKGEETTSQPL